MPGPIPIQAFYAALLLAAVVVAVTLPAAAWIAVRIRPGARGSARAPRLHWRPLARKGRPVTSSPALAEARVNRIRVARAVNKKTEKNLPGLRA